MHTDGIRLDCCNREREWRVKALRRSRWLASRAFLLPAKRIIQRGNNREPIFAADDDYRFFLSCLVKASRQHAVRVHAYVLMSNHTYLLITAPLLRAAGRAC